MDERHHYPVRRRGQSRRLEPNRDGAAWLERDTELFEADEYDRRLSLDNPRDGILYIRVRGWHGARGRGMYPGPMFSIKQDPLAVWSGDIYPREARRPACPSCDDWSRTSRCAQHTEKRIEEWIPSQMRPRWNWNAVAAEGRRISDEVRALGQFQASDLAGAIGEIVGADGVTYTIERVDPQ